MKFLPILPAAICAASVILLVNACRKDPKPRDPEQHSRILLKMSDGVNKYDRYEYNGAGQLSKHFYHLGVGADTIRDTYSYKNNRLEKLVHQGGDYQLYQYKDNRLWRRELFDYKDSNVYNFQFNYENGLLKQETGFEYHAGQWKENQRRIHIYNSRRDLVETELYLDEEFDGSFDKHHIISYQSYLENPDPQRELWMREFFPAEKQTCRLPQKEIHSDGQGFEEWTDESTYTFDKQGYPSGKTTISYNPSRNIIRRSTVQYTYHR